MISRALSIIIPTFNRASTLRRTVQALLCQDSGAQDCEIIVVDDGSSDNTFQVVSDLTGMSPIEVRYLHQENRGAGAARNHGLREARGDIILFVDDDIVGVPSMLAEHLRYHRLYPSPTVAVLGRVVLAPQIPPTPLNLRHLIYRWDSITDGQELTWQYFMTCNISLKRMFLLQNNLFFDEDLACSGYEDTEIGYRCSMEGLRIVYNAHALGYHNCALTLQGYLRMCERYGGALAVIHHKYPALRDELGDYLCFSWRNPPLRLAVDLVRPFLENRFTMGAFLSMARHLETHSGRAPFFLAHRLGSFYERRGFQVRERELRRRRDD